jgi:hypothetical protein
MKITAVVLILLTAGIMGKAALAAGPEKYTSKGSEAIADFYFGDQNCIFGTAHAHGFDDLAPQSTTPSWAHIDIYAYDYCNDTQVVGIFGNTELSGTEFTVSKGGTSATLVTTIDAYDYLNDQAFPFEVNLTWTATSKPTRLQYNYSHYRSPDFSSIELSNGVSVNANVVGVFQPSDGGTNYTNYADRFASISKSSNLFRI